MIKTTRDCTLHLLLEQRLVNRLEDLSGLEMSDEKFGPLGNALAKPARIKDVRELGLGLRFKVGTLTLTLT